MGDRILGVLGLIVAGLYVWRASLTQISFISDPVGPKAFPMVIGAMLALASLTILVFPDKTEKWPSLARLADIALVVVALVLYALALPEIGFVIATALATTFLSWRLGAKLMPAVIAGLATSGGIYLVFHLILGLSLAKGPLGF